MRAPRDTSSAMWKRQLEAYRAMSPGERLRRAAQLSEDVKALARSGIRHAHPDWPESSVEVELARRLFGGAGHSARPG